MSEIGEKGVTSGKCRMGGNLERERLVLALSFARVPLTSTARVSNMETSTGPNRGWDPCTVECGAARLHTPSATRARS
jgi:hypothetical protein